MCRLISGGHGMSVPVACGRLRCARTVVHPLPAQETVMATWRDFRLVGSESAPSTVFAVASECAELSRLAAVIDPADRFVLLAYARAFAEGAASAEDSHRAVSDVRS